MASVVRINCYRRFTEHRAYEFNMDVNNGPSKEGVGISEHKNYTSPLKKWVFVVTESKDVTIPKVGVLLTKSKMGLYSNNDNDHGNNTTNNIVNPSKEGVGFI